MTFHLLKFRWNEPKRTVFAIVDLQEDGKLRYGAAICHHGGVTPSREWLTDHWETAMERFEACPVILEIDNQLKENTKELRAFVRRELLHHGCYTHPIMVLKIPNQPEKFSMDRQNFDILMENIRSYNQEISSYNRELHLNPKTNAIQVHSIGTRVAPVYRMYVPDQTASKLFQNLPKCERDSFEDYHSPSRVSRLRNDSGFLI